MRLPALLSSESRVNSSGRKEEGKKKRVTPPFSPPDNKEVTNEE